MKYLIKCPKCNLTDLALNDKKEEKKAAAESYHCNSCSTDFSVKCSPCGSKIITGRSWKKGVLAAIILV